MMNGIYPLSRENLPGALGALAAIFPDEPDAQEAFKVSLNRKRGMGYFEYWVLIHEGKVIGTTGLYRESATRRDLWLGWFGVVPEHRGKGWGSKLLEFTVAKAQDMKANNLYLWTTNAPDMTVSALLYKKRGFKKVSTEKGKPYNTITYGLALPYVWRDQFRNLIPLDLIGGMYLYHIVKMIWNNVVGKKHPYGNVIAWSFNEDTHPTSFLKNFYRIGLAELKKRNRKDKVPIIKDFIRHVEANS